MRKFKTIIFDINSTICDNTKRKRKAIELAMNITIPDEFYSRIKKRDFPYIIKMLGFEPNSEIIKNVEKHFLEGEALYILDRPVKNAVEILNALASTYKIGYVTGRPKEQLALDFLKRYKFPLGPVIAKRISSGEGMKKVEMFKEMFKRLDTTPSETVSVGDMPEDALASKAVSMLSVGIAEFSTVDVNIMRNNFDYVIEKVSDLPKLLANLEGYDL